MLTYEMTDDERMEIDPRWIVPDPHIALAALDGEAEVLKTILIAITQRCPEARKLFSEFWIEGNGGIGDYSGPGSDDGPTYEMMERLRSEILGAS